MLDAAAAIARLLLDLPGVVAAPTTSSATKNAAFA